MRRTSTPTMAVVVNRVALLSSKTKIVSRERTGLVDDGWPHQYTRGVDRSRDDVAGPRYSRGPGYLRYERCPVKKRAGNFCCGKFSWRPTSGGGAVEDPARETLKCDVGHS